METYGSKADDSKEAGHHAGRSAEFAPPPPVPERQIRVPTIVLFDRHREQLEATERKEQERRIEGHEDGTEGQSNERDDAEGKEKKEKGTGAARAFPVVPHVFRPIIPRPTEIHPNDPAKAKEATPLEPEALPQPSTSAAEANAPGQSQEIQNPLSHPLQAEEQPAPSAHEAEPDDETGPAVPPTPEDPHAGIYSPEPAQPTAEASAPTPQAAAGGNQPPMPPNIPPVQSFGSVYPQPNNNVWNANSPHALQQNATYYQGGLAATPGINPNIAPVSTPAEHVPVYEKRSGVGLVAALLGLEYLARKRADKKQNKLIQENAKKQQEFAEMQQRLSEQQRSFRTEQQKQTTDMRRMQQVQERFGTTATPTPAFAERPATSAVPNMNGMPPIHERQAPNPVEATMPANLIQPQSPKEHVVQDGLRTYGVGEHNREVVDPTAGGQAFNEEQREIQRDPLTGVPRTHAAGAAHSQYAEQQAYASHGQYGFGGGSAGSGTGQAGVSEPMLPSGLTVPYLPAGAPTHVDPQHQLPSVAPRQKATSGAPGIWFWVMLALIVAAFFAAALI